MGKKRKSEPVATFESFENPVTDGADDPALDGERSPSEGDRSPSEGDRSPMSPQSPHSGSNRDRSLTAFEVEGLTCVASLSLPCVCRCAAVQAGCG